MTEKEKMLKGIEYISFGEELTKERQDAKEMIYDFNNLRPNEVEKRNNILKLLLGGTGKNYWIEPPFRCDYGYNITIGENFYSNYNLTILDCAKVEIGDNVFIAPNVNIFTASHPINFEERNKGIEFALPVIIGNNVWIGGGVTINPNVKIGENVVIGSGSVVTKNIPSNSVAVGNPCRVVREISEENKRNYFKEGEIIE